MPVHISIFIETHFPVSRPILKNAVEETLAEQKIQSDIEVSVSIVGDRKMKKLHGKFLGEATTTDVLSFPLEDNKSGFVNIPDGILRLGDIVVSYPVARRQAQEHNLLVDSEIKILVKHGMLHLLGIHHEDTDINE